MFNGIGTGMNNLFLLSDAATRSICAENLTGAKGGGGMCELAEGSARDAARDLGQAGR